MGKPFHYQELVGRIAAVVRCTQERRVLGSKKSCYGDVWGFKLMGTRRHGPMICSVGFPRKEASGHRSPSPLFLVHLRSQVSDVPASAHRGEAVTRPGLRAERGCRGLAIRVTAASANENRTMRISENARRRVLHDEANTRGYLASSGRRHAAHVRGRGPSRPHAAGHVERGRAETTREHSGSAQSHPDTLTVAPHHRKTH
jgi:hypothetical protein